MRPGALVFRVCTVLAVALVLQGTVLQALAVSRSSTHLSDADSLDAAVQAQAHEAEQDGAWEPNVHKLQKLPPQPLLEGVDYKGASKFTPRDCKGDRVCEASNKFMQKLFSQQYPSDCKSRDTKYLICYPLRPLGFGSTFHHMVWCLNLGFATGRTVIIRSQPDIFNKAPDCPDSRLKGMWECYFQPVSHCTEPAPGEGRREEWKEGVSETSDARVIYVAMEWGLDGYKTWAPKYIKEWLGDNSPVDPVIWVKGQLAWFLNRLNSKLTDFVERTKKSIGFVPPIAGIHVRRTDKVKGKSKEADAVDLSVYMAAVDKFFASHPELRSSSVRQSAVLEIHPPSNPPPQSPSTPPTPPPARNITNKRKPTDVDVSQLAKRIHQDLSADRPAGSSDPSSQPPPSQFAGGGSGNSARLRLPSVSLLERSQQRQQRFPAVVVTAPQQPQPKQQQQQQSQQHGSTTLKITQTVGAADKPRVFLATEDEGVMAEARAKWGDRYTFVVHPEAARADAEERNRYNYEGMRRMLADVDMLAHCDFFAGTYSSNLGRWVFELLHYYHDGRAPSTSTSVDKPWHYEL